MLDTENMQTTYKQYNFVPAARQRCPAAGKVTVGLASQVEWNCRFWFGLTLHASCKHRASFFTLFRHFTLPYPAIPYYCHAGQACFADLSGVYPPAGLEGPGVSKGNEHPTNSPRGICYSLLLLTFCDV